jgi:hypothetical protein
MFDLATGELRIGSATLQVGLSTADVARIGFVFGRQFNLKLSVVIKTIADESFSGHRVNMSLRFRNDHLERVDLALSYSPPLEEVALFKRHTEFLRRELGEPTKECERHVEHVQSIAMQANQ